MVTLTALCAWLLENRNEKAAPLSLSSWLMTDIHINVIQYGKYCYMRKQLKSVAIIYLRLVEDLLKSSCYCDLWNVSKHFSLGLGSW